MGFLQGTQQVPGHHQIQAESPLHLQCLDIAHSETNQVTAQSQGLQSQGCCCTRQSKRL